VLRAAYTEGLSRPAPGDLIASVQENVQLNQRNIGNPALQPAVSQNYDLSAEYYLPHLGVISASLFRKDIEKFIFTSSRTAADGVRENLKVNGEGGRLTGLELVWQQNLTFLPAPLSGLGYELNATFLDSEGRYPGRTGEDLPFVLAPERIYNAVLSYAYGPASVRASYNRMARRLESVGASALLDTYNAAVATWDLAAKYKFTRQVSAFCNVKNLTNQPSTIYQGHPGNPTSLVYYGRQINFGLNLDF
jgi:TonB-dependent receptor